MTPGTIEIAMLVALGACAIFWPTQLLSDRLYRWLRIAAVALVALQMLVTGPSLAMLPAYIVAMLFAALLLVGPGTSGEPSKIRESREGIKKTLMRWTMAAGALGAVLVSAFLHFAGAPVA